MRELNVNEIEKVNGGINGYEGAGAVMGIYGFGAALAVTPIGWAVGALALGAAGGLAIAEFISRSGGGRSGRSGSSGSSGIKVVWAYGGLLRNK